MLGVAGRLLDRAASGQSIAVICWRVKVSMAYLVFSIDRLNALAELDAAGTDLYSDQ